jgi:photosystem II stability/assembly factor-like uncharacterized protein
VSARTTAILILLAASCIAPAHAHDPSAWGGLFRSRDLGANWFPADAGLFIGGALGVAVHPRDPGQLLYGTDARLLRSKNGGRDWVTEGAATIAGAVFAVAFNGDGSGAMASSGTRIFFAENGLHWQDVLAPAGAAPARAFVPSPNIATRVYLAGAQGVYLSDDGGRSWVRAAEGLLPEAPVTSLAVSPGPSENIYAVIDGNVWVGNDGGRVWQKRMLGLPEGPVEVVSVDVQKPGRLWTIAAAKIFMSDDAGRNWSPHGGSLPEPGTLVRGLVVSANAQIFVLSTHRGVLRSTDGGYNWNQVESTLPVHLESGLLLRDPHDSSTLYAGFSLSPYGEMWRRAEHGSSPISRLDPVSLAGGLAFLVFVAFLGILLTRWLLRRSRGDNIEPHLH